MNDPEIDNFSQFHATTAGDALAQQQHGVASALAPGEFLTQAGAAIPTPSSVDDVVVPLPRIVESPVEDSPAQARPILLEIDGLRVIALESLKSAVSNLDGRFDRHAAPTALTVVTGDSDSDGDGPPSPSQHTPPFRSTSRSPRRASPKGGAGPGASTAFVCKWDGVSQGDHGTSDGPWHEAFEDVAAPLWAEQLAPGMMPERFLRYVIGTQAVLRDWRISYLPLRYGRRLPFIALAPSTAEAATNQLARIRVPVTEDGRRRLLRLEMNCPALSEWLQDLGSVVEGGIVNGVLLAAACICVWERLVQPVLPVWTIAECVVEWLSTVLATPDTPSATAALDAPTSTVSATLILFELVDVICATRQPSEALAFVTAARHACRDSPNRNMPDEVAWVRIILSRMLWAASEPLPPPRAAEGDDGDAEGDNGEEVNPDAVMEEAEQEEEEEEEKALADSSSSLTERGATSARPQSSSQQDSVVAPVRGVEEPSAAVVWSWALPLPVGGATASSEMPLAWIEYPRLMSEAIETLYNQDAGAGGTHSVVVDDIGRRFGVTDSLLYLEDDVSFGTMVALRGGVKLPLRRHGSPSTAFPSVAEMDGQVPAGAETPPDSLSDRADENRGASPVDAMGSVADILLAIEAKVTERYPPPPPPAAAAASKHAHTAGEAPAPTTAEAPDADDVDWQAASAIASPSRRGVDGDGDLHGSSSRRPPWFTKFNLERKRRLTLDERQERMVGVAPPSGDDGAGTTHVLSGCLLDERVGSYVAPSARRQTAASAATGGRERRGKPQRHPMQTLASRLCQGCGVRPADPTAVLMRYRDHHCDLVLSSSVVAFLTLLADEESQARGATIFMTTTADEVVPERVTLEHFDRDAQDASSGDDDDATPAITASRHVQSLRRSVSPPSTTPTERRSLTFDVCVNRCSPMVEAVVRRLALRSGCLSLVRQLARVARATAKVARPPGVFEDCIGTDGSHAVVTIAIAPYLGTATTNHGQPCSVSEALGIVPRANSAMMVNAPPNPNTQAVIQAHIRSVTPDVSKGAACSGVPLGGWKAVPRLANGGGPASGTFPHRHRRGTAGVDIPAAAIPSTALKSHIPPVSKTAFGLKALLAATAGRSATPTDHDTPNGLELLKREPLTAGESASPQPAGLIARAPTTRLRPLHAVAGLQPEETLGAHPRHPGATAEWAFLNAMRNRVACDGREDFALSQLRRHRAVLPPAPSTHELNAASIEKDIKRRQRQLAQRTTVDRVPHSVSQDIDAELALAEVPVAPRRRTTAALELAFATRNGASPLAPPKQRNPTAVTSQSAVRM